MKKLLILLLMILTSSFFAQELFYEREIIFHTRGSFNDTITTFEIRPVPYDFYPTVIYSYIKSDPCNVTLKLLPLQTIELNGNISCKYSGLEYIFSDEDCISGSACDGNAEYGSFGNSLYEINIKVNGNEKFRFLLDTRHNSLPNPGCFHECNGNDISIVYYVNSNTVGHKDGFWNGIDPLKSIKKNKYYTWGEIRNSCPSDFRNFNELYMPVLNEPISQNNSPLLTWLKPQNETNDFYAYELQRSINGSSFTTIFTSYDKNTTTFWDQDILWNPNLTQTTIAYRIFAIFDYYLYNMIVDVSNYQEITTSKWYIFKNNNLHKINAVSLSENYPNPFNPTTKINFQIPEDGIVELKVFDILGNEIKTLLNKFISSGNYTIDFNAINLPSGIYIYKLKFNNIVETKQMVLLK